MATQVENKTLVEAIAQLKIDPTTERRNEVINEVIRANYLSPVTIDPPPEKGPDGKAIFKKGTTIGFCEIIEPSGQRFLPAFTDWGELEKWKKDKDQQTFVTSFDDIAAVVLGKDGGDGFIVNPCGDSLRFQKDLVRSIKREKDVHTKKTSKDDTIELIDPVSVPAGLKDGITKKLRDIHEVKRAYLKSIKNGKETNFIIVVELEETQKKDEILRSIGMVAKPLVGGKEVFLAATDCEIGASVKKNGKPFYTI